MAKQDVEINLSGSALADLDNLQKASSKLEKELRGMVRGTKEYVETANQLKSVEATFKALQKEVGLTGMSLNQLTFASRKLQGEINKLAPGTAEFIAKAKELSQVKNRIAEVTAEMKRFEDASQTTFDKLSKKIKAFVGPVGATLLAVFSIQKVIEYGSQIDELTRKFSQMRNEIASLTGASGADLDTLAVGISAIAQKFDVEYNEVLLASNALAKQMGISQTQALDLIEKGFIKGANASGDYLDKIREYGIQFKNAGFSAEEFIKFTTQEVKGGVYSDKLLDSVKELGLRLREMTTAQKDALRNAFGDKFTTDFIKRIQTGQVSVKQAFEEIQTQAGKTGLSVSQTQTLIADLGGGALEDLGGLTEAFKQLDAAEKISLTTLTDYEKAQKKQLDAQKQLASVQNDLAKDLAPYITLIDQITIKFKIWTLEGIRATIAGIQSLSKFLYENRAALIPLTIAIVAYNAQLVYSAVVTRTWAIVTGIATAATNAWRIATIALNLAMRTNPIGFIIGLIASLVTGVVVAYNSFESFRAIVQGLFNVFANLGKILYSVLEDIGNFDITFSSAGKNIAKSFNEGYQAEMDKGKAQRQADNAKLIDERKKEAADAEAAALEEIQKANEELAAFNKQADLDQQAKQKEQYDKLLEAQKVYQEKKLAAEKAIEDLKISLIKDQYDKEIAETNIAFQRKIEEVKKNGVLVNEQTVLLEQQKNEKIADIENRRREETARKENELRQQAITDSLAFLDAEQQAKEAKIEENYLNSLLLAEERQILDDEAAIERFELLYEAEEAKEQALFDLRQSFLENQLIALEIAGQTETAQYQKISNDLVRIDLEKQNKLKKQEENKNQALNKIRQAETQAVSAFFDFLAEALEDNAEAQKLFAIVNAGIAIGEIVSSAGAAILAYRFSAAKTFPPGVADALSAKYAVATSIIAGAQIGKIVAQTAKKFEKGGQIKLANGGMVFGRSHAQGGIRIPGTNIEIEGNEFVTNRLSSSRNREALETINARPDMNFMAVPKRKFEVGGVLGSSSLSSLNANSETIASDSSASINMLMSKIDTLVEIINAKSDSFKEVNLSLLPLIDEIEEIQARKAQNQS